MSAGIHPTPSAASNASALPGQLFSQSALSHIEREPFYQAQGDEIATFEAASRRQLAVLLKGPTGCGKTRFVEYMAWRLRRPVVTVSCHDDLTTADLIGRYLIVGTDTVWLDGPLAAAVRAGAICYLDEVVEARKDTTVVIHPLTDTRRVLPIDKHGELLVAPPDFMLVVSYNPGYQSVLKELKPSTRQRFVALDFDYPAPEDEARIVASEGGIDLNRARQLVRLGTMTRALKGEGVDEGASTRLLIHAGLLMAEGLTPATACHAAVARALSDEADVVAAVGDLIGSVFAD